MDESPIGVKSDQISKHTLGIWFQRFVKLGPLLYFKTGCYRTPADFAKYDP
jgi:hypothetical protein